MQDETAFALTLQATEQAQQLGTTGADQPEQAEDLALVHLETHRFAQARPQQALHVQRHIAALPRTVVIDVLDVATDHARDELIMGQLAHVLEGPHVTTVLEHRHRIADAKHLFHAVADVEHHFALVSQAGDDRHQTVDFPGRQATGGLVESNDVGTTRQGLGDFHQLALAEGQATDFFLGVDFVGQAFEQRQRLLAQHATIDQAETRRQMAEKQVFSDGHFRHQVQFLVNHCHTTGDAVSGAFERHRLFADLQVAAARDVGTAQDLEQRGLAGAVFTHQGMDLPRMGNETDIGQRLHAGKGLADPVESQAAADVVLPCRCLRLHNHLELTEIKRPRHSCDQGRF